MTHHSRVREFMEKAGQELPTTIRIPTEEVRLLRARLILEEALETIEELGVEVYLNYNKGYEPDLVIDNVVFEAPEGRYAYLEGILDGCCDLKVVTEGTLIALGLTEEECAQAQEIVDESNLSKFGPGGYRDEHGKWIKPPTFVPPDFTPILGGAPDSIEGWN